MNYEETNKARLVTCRWQLRQLEAALHWKEIAAEDYMTRREYLTSEIKWLEEVISQPAERDSA